MFDIRFSVDEDSGVISALLEYRRDRESNTLCDHTCAIRERARAFNANTNVVNYVVREQRNRYRSPLSIVASIERRRVNYKYSAARHAENMPISISARPTEQETKKRDTIDRDRDREHV